MPNSIPRGRLFVAACTGLALFGLVLALLGTMCGFPEIRERLHIGLARQGDLFLLLYLGVLLATVFAGPLIDRFGNKMVLSFSSYLVAIALAGFAVAHSFAVTGATSILLGCGAGGLNISTNALVSDLYPSNRGAMLNLLGIFFGAGAMGFPLLAATVSGRIGILQLTWWAAALAALCGVAYGLLPFPSGREAHGFSVGAALRAARYPGVLLFAFLLFFESGNEASLNGWTSVWLGASGASPRHSTLVLAAYQASMMMGRVAGAALLRWVGKGHMVVAAALGAVLGTGVMLGWHTAMGMTAGVVISGLSFATIYPTMLALAGDRYQRFAGTVFGILFAISMVGAMVFPWSVGHLPRGATVHSGIAVPLGGAIGICVLAAVLRSRGELQGLTPEEGRPSSLVHSH